MLRFCIFLTLTISANTSMALGLSDITLKSNLGEALAASVMIDDVETAPDITCFVVKEMAGESALKRISTRLIENNQKYQLSISTSATVGEPIVNITVSYVCEPHIARSYVLLLDPAPLPTPVILTNETANAEPANIKNAADSKTINRTNEDKLIENKLGESKLSEKKSGENVQQNNTQPNSNSINNRLINADTTTDLSKAAKKSKKKANKPNKNISDNTNVDAKLMEAYVGKPSKLLDSKPSQTADNTTSEKPTASASKTNSNSAKPYLVISGGALSGGSPYETTQSGLTLQLETQIDFNRVAEAPALTTNEETLDEVTVMANRLAHLEKQILSLQRTNLQLKAKALEAENAGFKLTPSQKNWLHYAGILTGILLLIAIIEFARRQFLRHRLKRDEAIWFIGDDNRSTDDALSMGLNDSDGLDDIDSITNKAKLLNQSSLAAREQAESSVFINSDVKPGVGSANTQLVTEQEVENVLDHADVFIAHGRTNLAIQLLQNHLEEFPTESPAVWLKLLGLLASENSESDYEVAVTECNQFFNIKLPSYAEALNEDESSIENHPHIVSRLEGVWGSQYAIGFLNDLIYNQQSQPREGFARNTFEELFFLRQISEILQNDLMPEGTTHVYRAETVQPVLEKVAVNAAAFANVTPINSVLNQNAQVQKEDGLFDMPASKPAMNADGEMRIASFAAQDFKDDSNDSGYEVDILLEPEFEANETALTTAQSISGKGDDALYENDLPEILFASEVEQNLVKSEQHQTTQQSAFDDVDNPFDDVTFDVITEEIDFSAVAETANSDNAGLSIAVEMDDADLDLSAEIAQAVEDLSLTAAETNKDSKDGAEDTHTLAFDESAFKEISDAVKASMLEKSPEELAEADNSNMIEFDWDLPGTAETPTNDLKTSNKSSKK